MSLPLANSFKYDGTSPNFLFFYIFTSLRRLDYLLYSTLRQTECGDLKVSKHMELNQGRGR